MNIYTSNNIFKQTKNFCSNCGIQGHTYKNCIFPITSIGIILYYYDTHINDYKFLIIKRRNTLGFVDFIRGKYSIHSATHIQNLFNEMTDNEINTIKNKSFEEIWNLMWLDKKRSVDFSAKKKFEFIKNKLSTNINIDTLINNKTNSWSEQEWGFPKGRRNYNERDIDTAIREFSEETGILINNIKIFKNIKPFEELFIGSNYKAYKHKYYIGKIKKDKSIDLSNFQRSEVSEVGFFTKDEIKNKIRYYNKERILVLENIYNFIHSYNTTFNTDI